MTLPKADGWKVGQRLPVVSRTISQDQLVRYSEASGDHNPLHLDAEFAATTRFGGIIAHGMLTLAFVSEIMMRAFGRPWLETGSLKVRFKGAAYLGDQVEAWGEVRQEKLDSSHRLITCAVGVRKIQDGSELIAGTARLRLPL